MIYVSPHMLPQGNLAKPEKEPPLFSGQKLVIEPTTGVGASNARALSGALGVPGTAVIWSQTFHEALFKALGGSGLFEEVRRDGTALLQQSTAGSGATFKVHYVLNDSQSRRDLWVQDISASYVFPESPLTFVAPYNAQLDALMRACGQNIGSLIQNLAAIQPAAQAEP